MTWKWLEKVTMDLFWTNRVWIRSFFNVNWSLDFWDSWFPLSLRVVFMSFFNSWIFWTNHYVIIINEGCWQSIFKLIKIVDILWFNSRIIGSHKWWSHHNLLLWCKIRFNRSILVLSFNARKDRSSHQTVTIKRRLHWAFVVFRRIIDTPAFGTIADQQTLIVCFSDFRGELHLVINSPKHRTSNDKLSWLLFRDFLKLRLGFNTTKHWSLLDELTRHLFFNMAVVIGAKDIGIYGSWHFHPGSSSWHTGCHNVELIFGLNIWQFGTRHLQRTFNLGFNLRNVFATIDKGRMPVSNISVARTVELLWQIQFKTRAGTAEWLRGILAVMVWNWEHRSTHQKLSINLRGHHWTEFSTSSFNTLENRSIDLRLYTFSHWWGWNETVLAISETISGTSHQFWHTPNITRGLWGAHTSESMFCILENWVLECFRWWWSTGLRG